MNMRATVVMLVCVGAICFAVWGLMTLRGRSGLNQGRGSPPTASPETRCNYSADDVASLYHLLRVSGDVVFLKHLCRNRPDLIAHLVRAWQPCSVPDWVWTYMEPDNGLTYAIFCISSNYAWRDDKRLTLIGCQASRASEDGDNESIRGVIQFVATLKWSGVLEAPDFVTRPSVDGRKFRVDVCLSWENKHWEERGAPVIKGVFDGHEFRWLGFWDKTGEYKLDRLPEAYRMTGLLELKAEVTNTPVVPVVATENSILAPGKPGKGGSE